MKRVLHGLAMIGVLIIAVACGLPSGSPTDQPAAPTAAPLPATETATVAPAVATPTATEEAALTATAPAADTPTSEPQAVIQPTSADTVQALAYLLVEEDLWVYQEGSDPRQLTTSGDVRALSAAPDGAWVAFVRSADQVRYSLWAVHADGSERELLSASDFEAMPRPAEAFALSVGEMQWVPGTRQLAFSTRPLFEGPGAASSEDLWLVGVESGQRHQLLAPGEAGAFTFSPDGRQIALARADSISLIDIDGGNRRERVLTFPPVLTYSEWTYYPQVVWSADGSALRVVIPPEAALDRPEEPAAIWSVPADGSEPRLLVNIAPRPLTYPQLSPDGARVAYLSGTGPPESNRNDLHIANVDGTENIRYLTEDQLDFIGWAPDSRQFVFSVREPFRSYVGRVGESPRLLSDVPNVFNVQWIDADRFLFVSRSAEAVELRQGSAGAPSQLIYRATDPMEMLHFSLP